MRHFLFFTLLFIACPAWGLPPGYQEGNTNRVVFENRSGQAALVKLFGPSPHEVSVPNGEKRSVSVDPGEYYFLVRYGSTPTQYSYRRGEKFSVQAAPGQVAETTITLHSVPGGNLATKRSSEGEFGSTAVQESPASHDHAGRASAELPSGPSSDDRMYWQEVDKTNPEELESYLRKYPAGEFAELARARLKKLRGQQTSQADGSEAVPASSQPSSTDEHPIPDLTGTVWCTGGPDGCPDGYAFYFESKGVLGYVRPSGFPASENHKRYEGMWRQTGKLVYLRVEVTDDYAGAPTEPGTIAPWRKHIFESTGEIKWNTYLKPYPTRPDFQVQLPNVISLPDWEGKAGPWHLFQKGVVK